MISLVAKSFEKTSHLKTLLTFSAFVLWSLTLTWPLATSITTHILLGSEVTSTVPFLNLWTMGWNANQLLHGYPGYWNAPIFYPVAGSFAFSDPQPLTGFLSAPIWHHNPALAYNLVSILFLSLNGWSVFRLLNGTNIPFTPALFSGFLAQTLPFITHERGVLQLQPIFGMIWAFGSLWRLANDHGWRRSFELGFAIAITFLTSEYYGLFLLIILSPIAIDRFLNRRCLLFLQRILVAGLIAALFTLPVLLPQQSILNQAGFHRDLNIITRSSATLADYAHIPEQIIGGLIKRSPQPSRQALFPGFGLLALGGIGLIAGLRNRETRRWSVCLFITMGIAFLVSFGPNLQIGSWQPYLLLRNYFPGFENLRSPYRMAIWVQLALLLLASLSMTVLWKRNYRMLMISLATIALLELVPTTRNLTPVPEPLQLSARQDAALFLPYVHGSSAAAYEETATWMLQTLPRDIKLINGYSGYFPPQNREFKTLFEDFPTAAAIIQLQELDVQSIIIRTNWLTASQTVELDLLVNQEILTLVQDTPAYQFYALSTFP